MATELEVLKARVEKLEGYFNIARIVIVVLGIGSGFVGTLLYSVSKQVNALQGTVDEQTQAQVKKVQEAGAAELQKLTNYVASDAFLEKTHFVKENRHYRIEWEDQEYYLDVAGNSATNGTQPQLHQGGMQVWQSVPEK
jgi:hypothetical protein